MRSLAELRIDLPMSEAALNAVMRETIRRNRVRDGIVYVQVSRGAAARDHVFPPPGTRPTLVVTAKSLDRAALAERAAKGVKVISTPETRWATPRGGRWNSSRASRPTPWAMPTEIRRAPGLGFASSGTLTGNRAS